MLYISTETGFRVLQGLLQFVEDLYLQAKEKPLNEVLEALKESRPGMSNQFLRIMEQAVLNRQAKPEDWIQEIDHIHIDCMADLYSPVILDAFEKKVPSFNGIDMSKKNILIIDTLTYYSDIVVKERSVANANNSNRYATWSEHATAIKALLDNLLLLRGIKLVIGHEGYDKDLKKRALALQGDAVKNDIAGKFNIILYATDLLNKETGEHNRVFVTNPDVVEDNVDAKTQDPRISEIEPMDMSVIFNKLR